MKQGLIMLPLAVTTKKGTTETALRREQLRLCLRLASLNPAQQGDSHVTASHIQKLYRPNLLIS